MIDSKDLNESVDIEKYNFLKKGNIRVLIFYEDNSYLEKKVTLARSSSIEIRGKTYLVDPKAFVDGNIKTIMYFYDNPFPIEIEYKPTELTALDMRTEEELQDLKPEQKLVLGKVRINSEALHTILTTKFFNSLYETSGVPGKIILYILGGVLVTILAILQATGTVDIISLFAPSN